MSFSVSVGTTLFPGALVLSVSEGGTYEPNTLNGVRRRGQPSEGPIVVSSVLERGGNARSALMQ